MDGLLQAQNPDILNQSRPMPVAHSRRTRRHRNPLVLNQWAHRFSLRQGLVGSQVLFEITPVLAHPLSKLDEVKSRKFSAIGRAERIERSLSALPCRP